ncbi:hypothetical protein D9M68_786760 [compost metagenome]
MRRHEKVYTLTHSSSNFTSLPSSACTRGITRSGDFSSTGSASQPSWKSMRQTLSGWRCSSTDWLGWKGGSNQNQRSLGKSASIFTSAIRKRSRKVRPLLSSPSSLRIGLREPSAATT